MPLYVLLFCFFSLILNASERIVLFQSDIVVHLDATVTITETITVESRGHKIKRGIIRELPGPYNIVSVKKEGKPIFYEKVHGKNQLEIHIGGNTLIPRGKHTYQITYTTDDFVDFYNDYDELYVNITGNYWRLPIDQAKASITLPDNVDQSKITAEGYTGKIGQRGTDYQYSIQKNAVTFQTTRHLQQGEGLTAVVTWNKGVVQKPFWYVHWYENPYMYILIISLLLQLLFLVYLATMRRRHNKPGVIVPLFYPPQGMTPSVLGYMNSIASLQDRIIVADIIQLAVNGYISISTKTSFQDTIYSFFGSTTYTLELLKTEGATSHQKAILAILFSDNKSLSLSSKNRKPFERLREHIQRACNKETASYITGWPLQQLIIIALLFHGTFGAIAFFLAHIGFRHIEFYLIAYCVGSAIFFGLYNYTNRWYTKEGREVQDEIDGFLLFLTTTEIDRMHAVGTPPTKTPELYETYLPFAIAAGVEYRWTKQFEKLFADMQRGGKPYKPVWYVSSKPFAVSSFSSQFSSSFRSSGAGGKGSSGGGRGGGGGGGR